MRSGQRDPFKCLGVPVTASAVEVKRAYRKLVATWHPDRFALDSVQQRLAQERLKEINAAYADCLQQIGQRSASGAQSPPVAPPPRTAAPGPAAASQAPPASAPLPMTPALPQWPNLALLLVLVVGWGVALRRYGFTGAFLQYLGLLAIVPGIAAFWYNARLLRGRLMLVIYLLTIVGAGLFLVLNQAWHEQRLLVTVPSWQTGGEVGRGFGAAGGVNAGEFSLEPPAAAERGFGPTAPLAPATAAPLAPMAPMAPAAPVAPRAK